MSSALRSADYEKNMPTNLIGVKRLTARRRTQRDSLWPDAENIIFDTVGGGWARMPRTIPLVASLIDTMSGKERPGRVYLTLWAHEFGDGYVEVTDPAQLALEAGYITSRAERTFNERVTALEKLGFVRSAPRGLREHGFILLLDPHAVVVRMRTEDPKALPEAWWSAFVGRCADVGIQLPLASGKAVARS